MSHQHNFTRDIDGYYYCTNQPCGEVLDAEEYINYLELQGANDE